MIYWWDVHLKNIIKKYFKCPDFWIFHYLNPLFPDGNLKYHIYLFKLKLTHWMNTLIEWTHSLVFLDNSSRYFPESSLNSNRSSIKLKIVDEAILAGMRVNFASVLLSKMLSLTFAWKRLKFLMIWQQSQEGTMWETGYFCNALKSTKNCIP